ncbi:X-Pro dipeptidyl-peptidase protein [Thelonectria olida]|uniref:X-Pro dipeptidyl-peptidase protein n=1 Tax=Thelonectria olida TaxID=1576542 RepID=A0A9P9AWU0_9HYPO|nr:X-Pro dipeptidyl-peptidase protein [Thelonectria olida]
MSAVSIVKGSIKLAGLVFKPSSLSTKAPGLVIVHPTRGVKEQAASTYAKKHSQQGYVTICYDASQQGESERLPRYLEDPAASVTDASAVADYLQLLDYVDVNRIGIVGICAYGGYAVAATKGDHRFKAVAVVSAVSMVYGIRLGRSGNDDPAEKVAAVLDQVVQALQAEADGGESVTVPIVSPTLNENPTKDTRDTYEYTRWHTETLFKVLDGKNKGLKKVIMPNGGHIDFYDQEDYVNPTVEEIAGFFKPIV